MNITSRGELEQKQAIISHSVWASDGERLKKKNEFLWEKVDLFEKHFQIIKDRIYACSNVSRAKMQSDPFPTESETSLILTCKPSVSAIQSAEDKGHD